MVRLFVKPVRGCHTILVHCGFVDNLIQEHPFPSECHRGLVDFGRAPEKF